MSRLSSTNINGYAQLRAPSQLSETEKKVFGEVIASVRPGHFEPGDMQLLIEFCRWTVLVGELWEKTRTGTKADRYAALRALTSTEKTLFSCCRLLRLSPSSRAPHVPSREAQRRSVAHARTAASGSVYDQMETIDAQ